MSSYEFQRGEPAAIGLAVVGGDPAGYTVTAKLKPLGLLGNLPLPGVPVAATFEVEFRPADGTVPAHWMLSLDAATTGALAARRYAVDAVFRRGGVVAGITKPAFLTFLNSVSNP